MKLKTLFIFTACFFSLNAPIALLFPATQLSIYGITTGPGQNYMAQWAGLGSVAIALMAWFARNLTLTEARLVAVPTLFVYFILSFIISAYGILTGIMSVIGWSLAVICLLFTAGYGYMLFKKTIDL